MEKKTLDLTQYIFLWSKLANEHALRMICTHAPTNTHQMLSYFKQCIQLMNPSTYISDKNWWRTMNWNNFYTNDILDINCQIWNCRQALTIDIRKCSKPFDQTQINFAYYFVTLYGLPEWFSLFIQNPEKKVGESCVRFCSLLLACTNSAEQIHHRTIFLKANWHFKHLCDARVDESRVSILKLFIFYGQCFRHRNCNTRDIKIK